MSPAPDYSAKGIILMDRFAESSNPISADKVRVFPFLPENARSVAWINIEKADVEGKSQQMAELKARELAGSVGANGIVIYGEGKTMTAGPSKYPLFILRAKAVTYVE